MKNRKKYLLVRLGALGDIIHTLPSQQLLHQADPKCSIHWLTEAPYADLLSCVPGIKRLWIVNTRKWRSRPGQLNELIHLIKELRKEHFDAAIDFQGLLKSAILTRLARAGQRIGFASHQTREPIASRFYSDSPTVITEQRHRIQQCVQLLSVIRGFPGTNLEEKVSGQIPFQLPERCTVYVKEQLSRLSFKEPPVVLNPGAGWPTKIWPIERFTRLAAQIVEKLDRSVVVAWGPGERKMAEEIIAGNRNHRVAGFPTSILELVELCRLSSLMVAGDTGPLHLAVAVGTPTVAIMGPTYGWRNGPFNSLDEIVTHGRPCPRPYKRHCRDHFCMDIPVSDVFEAIERRLSKTTEGLPRSHARS
ncbi:MAG TPA: glycosyltransferase family 9 protein [Acidobacteriota bacterium]|nr:glycosyltransferase family 9 protein [Acidobacteriota bacterium]